MPRGDKSKYTDKQKRQAEHIEEGYEDRGVPAAVAKSRAWATVNKESGGGKKSGSGRGKPESHASSRKGGKLGGAASASRSAAERLGVREEGCRDPEEEPRGWGELINGLNRMDHCMSDHPVIHVSKPLENFMQSSIMSGRPWLPSGVASKASPPEHRRRRFSASGNSTNRDRVQSRFPPASRSQAP